MNKTYQQLKNKIIPKVRKPFYMQINGTCTECGESICYCEFRMKEKDKDITLSDCLRVLAKKSVKLEYWQDAGGHTFCFREFGDDGVGTAWDLTKNALHQQKPEVWEFLNNLI